MTLLLATPVACSEGQAAYGLPAVPQLQNLGEVFVQMLARKLQTDADEASDTPEPIALNWALTLPSGEELAAAQLAGGADAAAQIACDAARADALQPQSVDARAALELDLADTTLAAQATRAPGATTQQNADADSRTLDVDVADVAHVGSRSTGDAVGNVLQQIQTAKALKAAAKAQAVGNANEAPGAATKAAAVAQTANIPGDARAMTPAQEAAQPTTSAADALLAGSTPLAGQNAFAPAASTANPTPAAIPVALSHPQWAQSLGREVLHLARASAHEPQIAHLRLDPPELGPLRIAISLHDQVVQASFVSAHAPVRLAVETALTQLQEQLAEAGLSLGQTSVSDQGAAQQDSAQDAPNPHAAFALASASTPAPAERQSAAPARAPNALIDTFV